jgi:mono/diheme cytochrome c family protein
MLLSMIMERVLFASVDASWQMMPLPLSVAWGCIALGSLISFWQLRTTTEVNSIPDANQPEHRRGYLIVLLVVVASALRLIGVSAMEQGVVKRPISDPMGAQVYAAQGCAMCHTQLIRRDPQGTDLQRELDAGIEQVRVSEIEDWSASMGESSVHMGEVSIGPDLFNLVEKLETRPDVQTGGVSDWLYLHLYNPRDARLRHPYSVCPSLADDFILQPMRKNQKSEDALSVLAPSGMEVIPSEKIKHLVTYLLSLKRGAVCATQTNAGREVLIPQAQLNQRYYVDSNYAQNPPQLKKPSRGLSERTLARGRAMYLSKCSQCHGEEGQGKENLYPPLKGSEWVDKDSKTLTQIIRTGLTGPITVKGQSWNSTMLPPGVTNQTDIDAIIGYLRTHFGATHGGVAPTETNFPQK